MPHAAFQHAPPAQPDDAEHRTTPKPDFAPRFRGSGRLNGKAALITGGDSGIGRATAVLFAREGAKVVIVYYEQQKDADETLELVRAEGGEAIAIAGDIGDEAFCQKAMSRTIEAFGKLDVLVNGAAEQHPTGDLEAISAAQVERTFRTNIFGMIYMTQAALEHLETGAAIVNIASITAYRGHPKLLDYSATKGAIVAFTRSLAANLADKGIRVNGVAPGPIWTPLIPSTFTAEETEKFGKDTPLGRPGQPNEVAPSLLFLACADSSYMTGQMLHPNGGQPVES